MSTSFSHNNNNNNINNNMNQNSNDNPAPSPPDGAGPGLATEQQTILSPQRPPGASPSGRTNQNQNQSLNQHRQLYPRSVPVSRPLTPPSKERIVLQQIEDESHDQCINHGSDNNESDYQHHHGNSATVQISTSSNMGNSYRSTGPGGVGGQQQQVQNPHIMSKYFNQQHNQQRQMAAAAQKQFQLEQLVNKYAPYDIRQGSNQPTNQVNQSGQGTYFPKVSPDQRRQHNSDPRWTAVTSRRAPILNQQQVQQQTQTTERMLYQAQMAQQQQLQQQSNNNQGQIQQGGSVIGSGTSFQRDPYGLSMGMIQNNNKGSSGPGGLGGITRGIQQITQQQSSTSEIESNMSGQSSGLHLVMKKSSEGIQSSGQQQIPSGWTQIQNLQQQQQQKQGVTSNENSNIIVGQASATGSTSVIQQAGSQNQTNNLNLNPNTNNISSSGPASFLNSILGGVASGPVIGSPKRNPSPRKTPWKGIVVKGQQQLQNHQQYQILPITNYSQDSKNNSKEKNNVNNVVTAGQSNAKGQNSGSTVLNTNNVASVAAGQQGQAPPYTTLASLVTKMEQELGVNQHDIDKLKIKDEKDEMKHQSVKEVINDGNQIQKQTSKTAQTGEKGNWTTTAASSNAVASGVKSTTKASVIKKTNSTNKNSEKNSSTVTKSPRTGANNNAGVSTAGGNSYSNRQQSKNQNTVSSKDKPQSRFSKQTNDNKSGSKTKSMQQTKPMSDTVEQKTTSHTNESGSFSNFKESTQQQYVSADLPNGNKEIVENLIPHSDSAVSDAEDFATLVQAVEADAERVDRISRRQSKELEEAIVSNSVLQTIQFSEQSQTKLNLLLTEPDSIKSSGMIQQDVSILSDSKDHTQLLTLPKTESCQFSFVDGNEIQNTDVDSKKKSSDSKDSAQLKQSIDSIVPETELTERTRDAEADKKTESESLSKPINVESGDSNTKQQPIQSDSQSQTQQQIKVPVVSDLNHSTSVANQQAAKNNNVNDSKTTQNQPQDQVQINRHKLKTNSLERQFDEGSLFEKLQNLAASRKLEEERDALKQQLALETGQDGNITGAADGFHSGIGTNSNVVNNSTQNMNTLNMHSTLSGLSSKSKSSMKDSEASQQLVNQQQTGAGTVQQNQTIGQQSQGQQSQTKSEQQIENEVEIAPAGYSTIGKNETDTVPIIQKQENGNTSTDDSNNNITKKQSDLGSKLPKNAKENADHSKTELKEKQSTAEQNNDIQVQVQDADSATQVTVTATAPVQITVQKPLSDLNTNSYSERVNDISLDPQTPPKTDGIVPPRPSNSAGTGVTGISMTAPGPKFNHHVNKPSPLTLLSLPLDGPTILTTGSQTNQLGPTGLASGQNSVLASPVHGGNLIIPQNTPNHASQNLSMNNSHGGNGSVQVSLRGSAFSHSELLSNQNLSGGEENQSQSQKEGDVPDENDKNTNKTVITARGSAISKEEMEEMMEDQQDIDNKDHDAQNLEEFQQNFNRQNETIPPQPVGPKVQVVKQHLQQLPMAIAKAQNEPIVINNNHINKSIDINDSINTNVTTSSSFFGPGSTLGLGGKLGRAQTDQFNNSDEADRIKERALKKRARRYSEVVQQTIDIRPGFNFQKGGQGGAGTGPLSSLIAQQQLQTQKQQYQGQQSNNNLSQTNDNVSDDDDQFQYDDDPEDGPGNIDGMITSISVVHVESIKSKKSNKQNWDLSELLEGDEDLPSAEISPVNSSHAVIQNEKISKTTVTETYQGNNDTIKKRKNGGSNIEQISNEKQNEENDNISGIKKSASTDTDSKQKNGTGKSQQKANQYYNANSEQSTSVQEQPSETTQPQTKPRKKSLSHQEHERRKSLKQQEKTERNEERQRRKSLKSEELQQLPPLADSQDDEDSIDGDYDEDEDGVFQDRSALNMLMSIPDDQSLQTNDGPGPNGNDIDLGTSWTLKSNSNFNKQIQKQQSNLSPNSNQKKSMRGQLNDGSLLLSPRSMSVAGTGGGNHTPRGILSPRAMSLTSQQGQPGVVANVAYQVAANAAATLGLNSQINSVRASPRQSPRNSLMAQNNLNSNTGNSNNSRRESIRDAALRRQEENNNSIVHSPNYNGSPGHLSPIAGNRTPGSPLYNGGSTGGFYNNSNSKLMQAAVMGQTGQQQMGTRNAMSVNLNSATNSQGPQSSQGGNSGVTSHGLPSKKTPITVISELNDTNLSTFDNMNQQSQQQLSNLANMMGQNNLNNINQQIQDDNVIVGQGQLIIGPNAVVPSSQMPHYHQLQQLQLAEMMQNEQRDRSMQSGNNNVNQNQNQMIQNQSNIKAQQQGQQQSNSNLNSPGKKTPLDHQIASGRESLSNQNQQQSQNLQSQRSSQGQYGPGLPQAPITQTTTTTNHNRNHLVVQIPKSEASSRRSSVAQTNQTGSSPALSRRGSWNPVVEQTPSQAGNGIVGSTQSQQICRDDLDISLERDLKPGKTIGLGQFGRVFLAMENATGFLLAVKEILLPPPPPPSLEHDEEAQLEDDKALASLETELRLLKKLQHPHIVTYLGHEVIMTNLRDSDSNTLGANKNTVNIKNQSNSQNPDKLYIYLEYLSGGSIKTQLNEFGSFDDLLTLRYCRQLLSGVQYLHAQNIIHRDLKNANLLLTQNGELKIADFGCSKQLSNLFNLNNQQNQNYHNQCHNSNHVVQNQNQQQNESSQTETQSNNSHSGPGPGGGGNREYTITGTIPYMAPEVFTGNVKNWEKVDIWSLGCCILEMTTGKPPWYNYKFDNLLQAYYVISGASGANGKNGTKTSDVNDSESEDSGPGVLPLIPETSLACEFIKACLVRNTKKRPTAEELGSHKFLTENP